MYYENKFDRHSAIFSSSAGKSTHSKKELKDSNELSHKDVDETEMESESTQNRDSEKNDSKLFEQIIVKLKSRFKSRIILQETINSLSMMSYLKVIFVNF